MPFEIIVPVLAIGLVFPLFFIGLFVLIVFIIANTSGWTRLAKHYAFQGSFTGTKWQMQSARIGLSRYRGCLTVGTNSEGLYLATSFPFSFGHSPLFIPWSDITIVEQQEWPSKYLDLMFAQTQQIRFRFLHDFGTTVMATRPDWVGAVNNGRL